MRLARTAILLLLAALTPALAQPNPNAKHSPHHTGQLHLNGAATTAFPARDLRGYGRLSGDLVVWEAGLSRLRIVAADDAKAALVHAKFVSDLHLLGGVRDEALSVGEAKLIVHHVAPDGALLAWRQGAVLTVLAATDAEDLAALFRAQPERERAEIEAEPTEIGRAHV